MNLDYPLPRHDIYNTCTFMDLYSYNPFSPRPSLIATPKFNILTIFQTELTQIIPKNIPKNIPKRLETSRNVSKHPETSRNI
jgi:hypothetical protein